MIVVCQYIKDWYRYSSKNTEHCDSLQTLIDDLNIELEKE